MRKAFSSVENSKLDCCYYKRAKFGDLGQEFDAYIQVDILKFHEQYFRPNRKFLKILIGDCMFNATTIPGIDLF